MEDTKPQEEVKYFIDLNWFLENDRSFQILAQKRMCDPCREKLGTPVEERVPVVDSASGKVVFEAQIAPYGSDPMKAIGECCSKTPVFLDPRLPLLEIMFRIFLSRGNLSLSLEELEREVEEWIGSTDGRITSAPNLRRVMDGDDYYGIRPLVV